MVPATRDEMLRSIRAGEPSAVFLDMVVQKVRLALTPVPPPNGVSWRDEDVEQVAGDLIEEKWAKYAAVGWELETDSQLRAWTTTVARNYVRDLGRATPRGRLTRRVERIIGDLDDVWLAGGFVRGSGTRGPHQPTTGTAFSHRSGTSRPRPHGGTRLVTRIRLPVIGRT